MSTGARLCIQPWDNVYRKSDCLKKNGQETGFFQKTRVEKSEVDEKREMAEKGTERRR
jgi:hypothetical protein